MQSSVDAQALSRARESLDATVVDASERSEEAWSTALTQAVFERLPIALSIELSNRSSQQLNSVQTGSVSIDPDATGSAGKTLAASHTARGESVAQLSTEVQVGSLGRIAVQVTRSPGGLNIVIDVADGRVKSLLTAEVEVLLSSLKNAGLRVNSVKIEAGSHPGPALALDRDRLKGGSLQRPTLARLKAYRGMATGEELEAEDENLNLTV